MSVKQDAIHKQYDLLAPQVVKNLESRNFEAYYCKTKEEALQKALSLIPDGSSVSWGGSVSIGEIGLIEGVYRNKSLKILDRDKAADFAKRMEYMRQALLCDVYLTSTNALTEDGILVNIDANGNRVAAMTFGPKSVIMIVGMNKLTKTFKEALSRARNYAAPVNTLRLCAVSPLKTPCAATGTCGDCKSPDSICSFIVETRMCKFKGRIKVVLVGETLGF
ncbi:MAG: lactate utilization protein [Fusobacteriaceae bacterium]|jgi:L-lactate utilization protein LutB|nr:lactate utilization protein [Fusobacteriaceae bacterium]